MGSCVATKEERLIEVEALNERSQLIMQIR